MILVFTIRWHHTQLNGEDHRMCSNFCLVPVDDKQAAARFRINSPTNLKKITAKVPRSILKSAMRKSDRKRGRTELKRSKSLCFSPFNKVQLMSPRRSSVGSNTACRLFGNAGNVPEDWDQVNPKNTPSVFFFCQKNCFNAVFYFLKLFRT